MSRIIHFSAEQIDRMTVPQLRRAAASLRDQLQLVDGAERDRLRYGVMLVEERLEDIEPPLVERLKSAKHALYGSRSEARSRARAVRASMEDTGRNADEQRLKRAREFLHGPTETPARRRARELRAAWGQR